MRLSTLVALVSAGAMAAAAPVADLVDLRPKSFSGLGQLRTRWSEGDHADLGCLTDSGMWTTDESLCGTFLAKQWDQNGLTAFTLTSAAGPCRIYGAKFICEQGFPPADFGIWIFPNAIPGVDCLRYAKYGLMATFGHGPPSLSDPPQEIHMATYAEPSKFVWLTWAPLPRDGGYGEKRQMRM